MRALLLLTVLASTATAQEHPTVFADTEGYVIFEGGKVIASSVKLQDVSRIPAGEYRLSIGADGTVRITRLDITIWTLDAPDDPGEPEDPDPPQGTAKDKLQALAKTAPAVAKEREAIAIGLEGVADVPVTSRSQFLTSNRIVMNAVIRATSDATKDAWSDWRDAALAAVEGVEEAVELQALWKFLAEELSPNALREKPRGTE